QEADNFTDEPPERWRSPGDLPHQRSNRTATREKGTTLTTMDASSSVLMIRYRVGRRDELRRGCRKTQQRLHPRRTRSLKVICSGFSFADLSRVWVVDEEV
ncbi:unnamed protein product, partial [Brassica rapa subsp. narinosa]